MSQNAMLSAIRSNVNIKMFSAGGKHDLIDILKILLWLLHGEWTARVGDVGSGAMRREVPAVIQAGDDNGLD